jgi:hypothetical protein
VIGLPFAFEPVFHQKGNHKKMSQPQQQGGNTVVVTTPPRVYGGRAWGYPGGVNPFWGFPGYGYPVLGGYGYPGFYGGYPGFAPPLLYGGGTTTIAVAPAATSSVVA